MKDDSPGSGITIFTIPKPFKGHNKVTQLNAIRSWISLCPRPEIILLGKDEGTAETAVELGVLHIPDIDCNEYGTPLISSMFQKAQYNAKHNTVCYINADIILLSDFLPALQKIKKRSYLMVGRRWDLDVNELLDYSVKEWEKALRSRLSKEGQLHGISGIDYFAFPRGFYRDIPPFAVGRTAWDNWLIYRARALKASVIDATSAVTIIHQNHDYSHSAGGTTGIWKGPESERNKVLLGGADRAFSLEYATHFLTPSKVKFARSPRSLYFRLEAAPTLYPPLRFLLKPMKNITRLLGNIHSIFKGKGKPEKMLK